MMTDENGFKTCSALGELVGQQQISGKVNHKPDPRGPSFPGFASNDTSPRFPKKQLS